MERLTKRLEDGQAVMDCAACGVSWHKKREKDIPHCTALFCRNRLKERLAAYEDTGLEPEEVAELVSPETVEIARLLEKMCKEGSAQHMLELFQAEKDGLLVALPCKVGTPVHGKYGNWSGEVMEFSINSDGVHLYVRSGGGGFYCKPEDIDVEAALKGGEGL